MNLTEGARHAQEEAEAKVGHFCYTKTPMHTKLGIFIHFAMAVCCIPKSVHFDLDLDLGFTSKTGHFSYTTTHRHTQNFQ